MLNILKGKIISKTSLLGVIAPSSYENRTVIDKKLNAFTSLGYKIKLGKHIYDKSSFFAGSDYNRANDIINMFLDKDVNGIICLRGGYGSINTLPYINPDIIIHNPKFFCGFSDITMLLNYFSSLGLITFHGPMINSNFNDIETYNSFVQVSSFNSKNYTYNLSNLKYIRYINAASFSGKIVGGNLSVICSSIGTPYEISGENSIVLLEEVNEYPYAIHRMLNHLIKANFFNNCKGIIIGYLSNTTDYHKNIKNLFLENTVISVLYNLNIPIILGFPFGHNYPNLTIPIGAYASFSIENKTLTILDNFLK